MKLSFRPRVFVLGFATLGTVTFATALVVACGEMNKTETVPNVEPTPNTQTTQVTKDLDTMEVLAKNVKIDPVTATHDVLMWLNIPPLTMTSELSVQLEWAIGKASTESEASKLVWQKTLPLSASAVHRERHLWARISPKIISTDPASTRYLNLTQNSGIQQVRTNLDALINSDPSLQITTLKLSGTTNELILENAPTTHPGLALQWSIKVGTSIASESWYDWAGFATLLRATRPSTSDLQTIRLRYAVIDASLYQLKSSFETKPIIEISPLAVEHPIDVLSEIKNVLSQIRVDVPNSLHSALLWLNIPQFAPAWADELLSIEYRTSLGGDNSDIQYSAWTTELPRVTAFSSEARSLTARVTPKRGVNWQVTELDLTTSSEISRVLGLLDTLPAVQDALATLDLSKVTLSSRDAYGIFGALGIVTNNEATLATLRANQIDLRFAYQNFDKWLTFAELQSYVETDEAFANYRANDFGTVEGRILARLEYLGPNKQFTLRDRKAALVNVRDLTPLSTYTIADRVTRLVRRAAVVNVSGSTHSNLMWPLAMNYEVQLTPAMQAGIKDLNFTYTYYEPTAGNANPPLTTFSKLPNVTIGDYSNRVLTAQFTTLNNVVITLDLTESSQIKKVKRLIDLTASYRELVAPKLLINLTAAKRTWATLLLDSGDTTTYEWNDKMFLYAKGDVNYAAYEQIGVRLQARLTYNGKTEEIDFASLPVFLARRMRFWRVAAQPGEIFSVEKLEVFFTPIDKDHNVINDDKTAKVILSEAISPSVLNDNGYVAFTAK